MSDDYLSRQEMRQETDRQQDQGDHINLPPCPDCGQAVDDLRVQDTLAMKASLPGRTLAVNLGRTHRTTSLVPCGCAVREYDIRKIRDEYRICKIVMTTGWKWELGWEGQEIAVDGVADAKAALGRAWEAASDPEPQPTSGPDYHANHQAWVERQRWD